MAWKAYFAPGWKMMSRTQAIIKGKFSPPTDRGKMLLLRLWHWLVPVLASSLVFNLADGQFSSRADLIDAPGSSLGRGAQVAGLEVTVATGEVINQLLHHVGAMCIHQLNLLAASSNCLPLGALLGKQHPIEARHFSSICDIMEKAMVNGDTCIIRCILVVFQVVSPSLRYLMAVQNHLLSNTILIRSDDGDDSDSSLQGETLKVQELQSSILSLATKVLVGCDEVLETLQQVTTALINNDIADKETRLRGLEQITKATMLGHLLPVLLTTLMHPNLQTLTLADALMPQLVQLVLYTSQTALLLKTQSPIFSDETQVMSGSLVQGAKTRFAETKILDEREEPGFLTGLKIPAPWAAGKTVETVHPVRDNYKFKETVHIPGARCLYLRFDSRCSSQYDYDKLVIYAGPNTNSRKVTEYGGNTLGYGSRSVLGTGWPKDLVKVEGDTVTFSFEMRSGREHNTPDKAMWGFSCTVRAQESSEDVSGGLPFLADLALGLSVLACSMLRILYTGPEVTKEEEACHDLLCSKLLQRCQWQVEANGAISPALTPSPSPLPLTIEEDREFTYPADMLIPPPGLMPGSYFDLPRIRLPPGIMGRLREVSGRARPQFRPSIKEVIRPDVMEEVIVSCVIKHLSLMDALQSLINYQYREDHTEEYDLLCKIMAETFKKINAMERQLQSDQHACWHTRSRIEELTCGGMVEQVQEAFGETMTSVVSLCARYPIACANSIGLLCTIPYTRSEEQCLVRSGLVQLLDSLCSLSGQRESSSSEKQTKKQKVATMAWAAFQVLANRCIEWEKVEGGSRDAVHSGLARQVSSLLTNHLARATECCGNQAAGNDALQDVLSLLNDLSSSSEGRPFRLGTGANMEKVVKMDRDMTKSGSCEVITEEASAALRKANKWAQSGLIVSVGPPVEALAQEAAGGISTGDKKKTAQTAVCRDRNAELARSDPIRPFISGHVANSMAAEVIALLHSLLTAPESNTAQIWTSTAEKVLSRALMFIPQIGKYAESILENGSSSGRKLAKLQAIGRQAVAALCALGGFKETIKIGSEVQVVGKGVLGSMGIVMSINEQEGIAAVKFPSCEYKKSCKASDILTVPISRLCTPRSEALPLYKLSITEKVVQAVQSMLLPQEGSLSIHTSLPATGDGSSPVMAAVRLLAEIRSRACLVMAQLLEDSSFCEEFIQQCPAAVEVLNLVAQECSPVAITKDIFCLCKPGDVAGIGWERSECTPPPPGQAPKGRVYFTYGGQRLSPILEDVAGGMWPLVHIQKKEDHYALLVKAWETKVFPTIRRRFRNEAERKSGLDQIKGALQLVKIIKLNMLLKYVHVFVQVNELVQVETYLRSEGLLVRYWYPIEMLERPPAGSRRTAANGLVSLDSTNIQIHRELLRCESALARLYCRMALLNIFAPKNPHTFTRLFHIPAIRDITLEHLQLLSNQLLAPPLSGKYSCFCILFFNCCRGNACVLIAVMLFFSPDGTISSSSILLAQSLLHNLQGQSCSPSELFYQGNAQPIQEWLTVAITRALHQGEESLLELTKQVCCFLQNAPDQFTSEEFPVTESKVSMDVSFPGAAFVIVSCKESQLGCRKDSSLYKAPWARVMVYGLGHKVRRNGQLNLMEAVCYPLDASPTNTGLTPPPTTNQYPSVIIPTDKVHIKLEERYLTLEGFQKFAVDRAKQDIRSIWRGILACGYDLHFER
ncbi:unnamed protein product [Tetraodon nigroviridis]|uniref:(spotted green pufferfish) hypothetical protein n=1 Tax=Tetraodon nigroviridis TaxID=99883 RepID=Q4SZZ0_TETNG|nr:unnamed protein product [Tetraodon nigroviridis]